MSDEGWQQHLRENVIDGVTEVVFHDTRPGEGATWSLTGHGGKITASVPRYPGDVPDDAIARFITLGILPHGARLVLDSEISAYNDTMKIFEHYHPDCAGWRVLTDPEVIATDVAFARLPENPDDEGYSRIVYRSSNLVAWTFTEEVVAGLWRTRAHRTTLSEVLASEPVTTITDADLAVLDDPAHSDIERDTAAFNISGLVELYIAVAVQQSQWAPEGETGVETHHRLDGAVRRAERAVRLMRLVRATHARQSLAASDQDEVALARRLGITPEQLSMVLEPSMPVFTIPEYD